MRRADRIGGWFLLVFAVWFGAVALRSYTYWGAAGPGSGFFPIWLGVALAVLAVALLTQAARAPAEPGAGARPGSGRRVIVVIAATAAFIALMKVVGMLAGTVLFLVTVLRLLERYPWPLILGVAVGTAGVNYLVFTFWLRVPFPTGMLGF